MGSRIKDDSTLKVWHLEIPALSVDVVSDARNFIKFKRTVAWLNYNTFELTENFFTKSHLPK
jgi:hypothetical protein